MSEPEIHDELVRKSRRGDLDAFGELVRLHEQPVRAFLRSRLADWSAADDLAQEAFITAFRSLPKLKEGSNFGSWVIGVAHNHLRNFRRKRRDQPIGGEMELQGMIDGAFEEEWETEDGAALEALRECVARIDGPSRRLLVGKYVGGKTFKELAGESRRTLSAVAMQVQRLRHQLADCVERKLRAAAR